METRSARGGAPCLSVAATKASWPSLTWPSTCSAIGAWMPGSSPGMTNLLGCFAIIFDPLGRKQHGTIWYEQIQLRADPRFLQIACGPILRARQPGGGGCAGPHLR